MKLNDLRRLFIVQNTSALPVPSREVDEGRAPAADGKLLAGAGPNVVVDDRLAFRKTAPPLHGKIIAFSGEFARDVPTLAKRAERAGACVYSGLRGALIAGTGRRRDVRLVAGAGSPHELLQGASGNSVEIWSEHQFMSESSALGALKGVAITSRGVDPSSCQTVVDSIRMEAVIAFGWPVWTVAKLGISDENFITVNLLDGDKCDVARARIVTKSLGDASLVIHIPEAP